MALTNADELAIKGLLETFVTAWAKGETSDLDQLLSPSCVLDFSIFDEGITIEDLKRELARRTHTTTYTRFEIHNYVGVVGHDAAQQSAAITGMFVDESGDAPSNWAFSAFMANRLVRTAEGWRFAELHLELGYGSESHMRLRTTGVEIDRLDGDPSFVANWHLVRPEVGWHEGSRMLRIVPEVDAPWYAITDRTNTDDADEDKIAECLYAYCFGIDHDIVQLYTEVFADDATATYNFDRLYDKRSVTEMLKFERAGMIGTGHIVDPVDIRVEGDRATAHVYRAALNAIPCALLVGEGKRENWYCARYDFSFTRGADGVWRIQKLEYFQDMIKVPLAEGIFAVEVGA